MHPPTSKAAKLAAAMLREYAADGVKAAAMMLIVPTVIRAMQRLPASTAPSLETSQAVLSNAAQDLEVIANAGGTRQ